MTGELPDPFVPPECDLNGYDFMPYYGERFAKSDHKLCTDAEFRASINLWWSCWATRPAASLPSNERQLAMLAGLGEGSAAMKAWAKVRDHAMRNFVLCNDGRYYHTFLAPLAFDAWQLRLKNSKRGKAGATARWQRMLGASKNIRGAVDNSGKAGETQCSEHHESMLEASEIDATTKENDSKRSNSSTNTSTSRKTTAGQHDRSNPADPSHPTPRASGRSAYETRIVAEGDRKGLKPRTGETLEAFEARVRTTRA